MAAAINCLCTRSRRAQAGALAEGASAAGIPSLETPKLRGVRSWGLGSGGIIRSEPHDVFGITAPKHMRRGAALGPRTLT